MENRPIDPGSTGRDVPTDLPRQWLGSVGTTGHSDRGKRLCPSSACGHHLGQHGQCPLERHFLLSSDFLITFSQVSQASFSPQKYKAKSNIGMFWVWDFFSSKLKKGELNGHELNLHPLHRKSWQCNA